jgi:hypothetical protein
MVATLLNQKVTGAKPVVFRNQKNATSEQDHAEASPHKWLTNVRNAINRMASMAEGYFSQTAVSEINLELTDLPHRRTDVLL